MTGEDGPPLPAAVRGLQEHVPTAAALQRAGQAGKCKTC